MRNQEQIEFLDVFEAYHDGSKSDADRLRAAATAVVDDQTPLEDYAGEQVSESYVRMKLAELEGVGGPYVGLTYSAAAKLTLKHLNAVHEA